MWRKLKWKSLLVLGVTALALWLSYPPLDVYDDQGELVKEGRLNLGLDLQGGMRLLLEVDTSGLSSEEAADAPQRALTVIRNRIDQFGVMEPKTRTTGDGRLLVQLPGITDRERATEIIGRTAHLEFRIVEDDSQLLQQALDGDVPEGYDLKEYQGRRDMTDQLLVREEALLTGDMLVNATTEFSQEAFGRPFVSLQFNTEGSRRFAEVTAANVGRRLAIVLDGEVNTAPVILEAIPSGRAQITGDFSVEEARDMAIVLRAGALPAPVDIIEERSVGPGLGALSVERGVRAVLIGGMLVLLFMLIYYLYCGLVANVALLLNILLITASLSCFGATLTLPGIAGLLLTIGIAVDSNVLIFERIREESKLGKSLRASIKGGYDKALLTILDANVTTLITALILFWFGTGPIMGFAVTLSIGILASMFTALVVTRLILDATTLIKRNLEKLRMLQFFAKPDIDFAKLRKIAYSLSIFSIAVGIFFFAQRGRDNFGIDFTGGALQHFQFEEEVSVERLRGVLDEIGLEEATLQQFDEGREFVVRTDLDFTEDISKAFEEVFGSQAFELVRVETVGPAVGEDLRRDGILALVLAMLGICVYISIRFEFRFAVTAIIAIFHDVLFSLGMIALTARKINLPIIAALLTVVGYSINDTIVVFDRIREDRKFMRKASFSEIINASINQTLSRTVLTSVTTLLVILSLYFFGGSVINDFAFVLLVGVLVGTYSSMFVASPLLLDWANFSKRVR